MDRQGGRVGGRRVGGGGRWDRPTEGPDDEMQGRRRHDDRDDGGAGDTGGEVK